MKRNRSELTAVSVAEMEMMNCSAGDIYGNEMSSSIDSQFMEESVLFSEMSRYVQDDNGKARNGNK